jgi:hypothetical protein
MRVMSEWSAEHEALHRSWRRWNLATYIAGGWAVLATALLPFGPDLLIFLFSIAPTNARTLLVTGWVIMIAIATSLAGLFGWRRYQARKRAVAAGVDLSRRRR